MPIDLCPVCGGQRLRDFLQRNHVPVHQNLVVSDQYAARTVTRGQLNFVVCEGCGFVFNRSFDLALMAYGENYDNKQSCSAFFDAYLDKQVKDLVELQNVHDCTIVEVGCGRGEFVRKLVSYPGSGNRGVGFDPSYVGPGSDLGGRLSFRSCYFDASCSDVPADVVVCRHVIEHVPDPLALLHSIKAALSQSIYARVFFETPCVEWILHNRVLWDLFYEHCSLFSATSLSLAMEQAGLKVLRVEHIFGGQYLWCEARVDFTQFAPQILQQNTSELALAYGDEEQIMRQKWRIRLEKLNLRGNVALWGAGAKGATLCQLVDPACVLIECVVDMNPNKQGRFIPGTGHPIVAPTELAKHGVKFAVLMNPNYRAEIFRLLAEAGIEIDLIDGDE